FNLLVCLVYIYLCHVFFVIYDLYMFFFTCYSFFLFFFNNTATTEIYTLSLHDALPISELWLKQLNLSAKSRSHVRHMLHTLVDRSEEHTSELQSQSNLVCRLLLEKKKKKNNTDNP